MVGAIGRPTMTTDQAERLVGALERLATAAETLAKNTAPTVRGTKEKPYDMTIADLLDGIDRGIDNVREAMEDRRE